MVADSRDVALNHTAGLAPPQQALMTLFSLFALLDHDDGYQRRCRRIIRARLDALASGLGMELPEDHLRVGYYVDLDLAVWGRRAFGEEFTRYVAAHHRPLDIVMELARHHGSVLLNGSGFDGPPWSVRISLANLNTDAYEAIGGDLKEIAAAAVRQWRASRPAGE
jgi:aspartate 4-decarboxylase